MCSNVVVVPQQQQQQQQRGRNGSSGNGNGSGVSLFCILTTLAKVAPGTLFYRGNGVSTLRSGPGGLSRSPTRGPGSISLYSDHPCKNSSRDIVLSRKRRPHPQIWSKWSFESETLIIAEAVLPNCSSEPENTDYS